LTSGTAQISALELETTWGPFDSARAQTNKPSAWLKTAGKIKDMECSIKNDDLIRDIDGRPIATYCDECGLWRDATGDIISFLDRNRIRTSGITIDGFPFELEFCDGHESDE